jgi:hypothetical protein
MRAWSTAVAVALGLGLAAYPLAIAPEGRSVAALGAGGLVCVGAALTWRRVRGLGVAAVVLLALHYAFALHAGHVGLDVYAPLVAVGLYALAEAIDLSIALADVAPFTRAALVRRLTTAFVVGTAGGTIALLAVLARSLFAGDSATRVVIGAVCALGVTALPLWLAQRLAPRR